MSEKKPSKDRLMTEAEFEEFDAQCQIQRLIEMILILSNRVSDMEKEVYGSKYSNTGRD